MQTQDIRQLAEWLAATDIDFLELSGPGIEVKLHRHSAVPSGNDPAVARSEAPPGEDVRSVDRMAVCASSPGVLLDRIPGAAAPLCVPGDAVQAGGVLAVLSIGCLLLPVRAPCDGWAGNWLVPSGSTVGYGTHLLNIDTGIDENPASVHASPEELPWTST